MAHVSKKELKRRGILIAAGKLKKRHAKKVSKVKAAKDKAADILKTKTEAQQRANLILSTGLASALFGLSTSEAERTAITAAGKFAESQTLLQAGGFKRQAEDVIVRGEEAARAIRRDVRSLIGAQRAALGASGIQLGTGTAAALQAEAQLLGDLDAITVKNNAMRQAFGFKQQALQAETQARIDRISRKAEASSQRIAGIQGAISTGIGAFQGFKKAGGIDASSTK